MKSIYLLSLLQAGMLAYAQESDATNNDDGAVGTSDIPDAYAEAFQYLTGVELSPIVTVSPATTAINSWENYGTVTVTSTRTFVDYCGCGIPGVSTIVGPTLISTTSTTSSTSITSSTSDTTTTTTLVTDSAILAPPTVTTSISTSTTTDGNTIDPNLTGTSSTTTTSSTSTSSTSTTSTSTTSTSTSSTSTSSTSTTSTSTTSTSTTSTSTTTTSSTTTTTTSSTSTTTTTTTSTTTTAGPVVTDQAYIDTVLRHHNVHRNNHTAPLATWSATLAETARKIAASCVYDHDTTTDASTIGAYGQNIGAGFPSNMMGAFITEGLYNSEVNSYTYYGGEPDPNTVGAWGHFSQVVWKASNLVGCYTMDCSATGLQNAPGIPPYFTVCNYQAQGNVLGSFATNVGTPLGNPTVFANYGCPSRANCAGTQQ